MELLNLTLGPLATACVFGIIVIFFYWRSARKYSYWKKRRVPYVEPAPFVGSMFTSFSKPLHELELERRNKHGRIYGFFEGSSVFLSVSEPRLLRDIMVKDFQSFPGRRTFSTGDNITENFLTGLQGEDWKRIRAIVSPTFTTGRIKRMMSIFEDCSKTLVENFKVSAENQEPVEARRIYGAYTMDIIASSAFSTKLNSHNDPNNEFSVNARKYFEALKGWRIIMYFLFPEIMKLLKIPVIPPNLLSFFCDTTNQIIEERKRTGQTRNDFLQLLIDTAKEVDEGERNETPGKESKDITDNYVKDEGATDIFKSCSSKKCLSFDELVAQCVIFFVAGFDTTAATLSFATYALALNEDIQDKVRAEVDKVIKENNGQMTYEAIQSMKYLDNVISETLRLYPPGVRGERVAAVDYKLGSTGIIVQKGTLISIPIYSLHTDPEFYPEPEKFDPDRFTAEERAKRDQYSYLPFGAGPRNCVAMRFALMEVKVCLAFVLCNFRIKRCPQTKVPLEYDKGPGALALLTPKDVTVSMEVRKDNPLTN